MTLSDLRRYAIARTLLRSDDPPTRDRQAGFRPGRSDPRPGARAGPHAAASRRELSRRRSRTAVPAARARRGLLHQLRLPAAPAAGADASAVGDAAVESGDEAARAGDSRIRSRAGFGASAKVDEHFAHGTVTNYWGGASNATTHLLDGMHYRGLLRVTRRESGVRIYAAHEHAPRPADAAARRENLDLLADIIVRKYAPLPAGTLSVLVRRLRYAAPQLKRGIDARSLARSGDSRTRESKASTGTGPKTRSQAPRARRSTIRSGCSRRSTPSSGIVAASSCSGRGRIDSRRTTPPSKRRFGYYALPLLWREHVIGWANVSVKDRRAGGRVRIRQTARARRATASSGASSRRKWSACKRSCGSDCRSSVRAELMSHRPSGRMRATSTSVRWRSTAELARVERARACAKSTFHVARGRPFARPRGARCSAGDGRGASCRGLAGIQSRRTSRHRGPRIARPRARGAAERAVRVPGAKDHGEPRARRSAEGVRPLRSADRDRHPRRNEADSRQRARELRIRRRARAGWRTASDSRRAADGALRAARPPRLRAACGERCGGGARARSSHLSGGLTACRVRPPRGPRAPLTAGCARRRARRNRLQFPISPTCAGNRRRNARSRSPPRAHTAC